MKKWFEKWSAEKAKRKEKNLPAIVEYRDETYVSLPFTHMHSQLIISGDLPLSYLHYCIIPITLFVAIRLHHLSHLSYRHISAGSFLQRILDTVIHPTFSSHLHASHSNALYTS